MSFSDLVKAAKHKYIKRIPKPRGGYRYVYTATRAGGVAKEAHFKAGAAFKLTFDGQEGHFHITGEEGDTLTIKHDELHGPEHSGVKMTRAELAALLTKEHAPALERAAEKKRARAEKKDTPAPTQDKEARLKEISQELNTLKDSPKKNAEKILKLERERSELIYGADEPAPSQDKERPNRFETMPPSDDYKREGPLSDKGSAALNEALGEALEKGNLEQAAELRARADRAALHTGAPVVDTLLSDLLSKAETRELPDGTRHREHTAQLTTAEANALEEAVDKGALVSHQAGEITTYRAATERTGAAKSTSFRLMVKDGRASLVYDDFSATAPQSAEDSTFKPEPARDAAQVESVLSELEQLMKNNPNLLNDPRLKGLIGSLEDTPPKTQGATTPLFITGLDGVQRTQEARFVLMEAGDVIGSHDPLSFAQREDYPEGIQERDYHQNPTEQLKVERNAANLEPAYLLNTNPDATNGPPIVTPEGIALGGNSRTMSLQLAYGRGSKGADKYKAELTRQAAAYGFTEADVKALKAPVLVRVYEPTDNSQRTLAQLVRSMNESKTQGLDARIEGRALASKLSEQTLKTISQAIKEAPEGFTLNRVLTRPSKGLTEIISNLMKDGVITQESGPKYLRDNGTMTAAGRELVAQVLVGYVIRDEKTLRNMDFLTMENLSVALGKLAGAGVGPAVKDALESAVTIYDMAIRRDLITARGSIQSRLEGVTHALNEVDAFGKVSVGETDIEAHKDTIRNNPLASAFLQILITNKGSRGIEDSITRFIDLTTQKEQVSMFESAEPMDYTEAARAIVQELAKEHNIDARLFSDIEAERKAREASAGPSLL